VVNAVQAARAAVWVFGLTALLAGSSNVQAAPLRFVDEAVQRGGADTAVNSTGPTFGDYDNDGDLDVFVPARVGDGFGQLYVNAVNPAANTLIRVQLRADGAPLAGGPRVDLIANGVVVRTETVDAGLNFMSTQNHATPISFFGLTPTLSYTLRVTYTDGVTLETVLGTPTGALLTVDRGLRAEAEGLGVDRLSAVEAILGAAATTRCAARAATTRSPAAKATTR